MENDDKLIRKLEFYEAMEKRIMMHKMQKNKRLMNLGSFHLYCQEIVEELRLGQYCWSKQASKTLMQVVEDYLIQIFEDSNYCAEHTKRITLQVKDVRLVLRLRSRYECFIGSRIN